VQQPLLLGQLVRDVHRAMRAAFDEALRPQHLTLSQIPAWLR
jgi:hypothetical protein